MSLLNSISSFFDDLTTSRRHAPPKRPARSTSPTHLPFYSNGHPQSSSTNTLPLSRTGNPSPQTTPKQLNLLLRNKSSLRRSKTSFLGSSHSVHTIYFNYKATNPFISIYPPRTPETRVRDPVTRTQSQWRSTPSSRTR
jgi:hypothetical protein